jgi:general secretion pathway protein D
VVVSVIPGRLIYLLVLPGAVLLSGCYAKNQPAVPAVTPSEVFDEPPAVPTPAVDSAPIPELSPASAWLTRDAVARPTVERRIRAPDDALYTVAVKQLPVNEVLFALAQDTSLDLEIIGDINGDITLNAVRQPLEKILDKIAAQVPLRHSVRDGAIVIEADLPFIRTYRVDYLNIARTTETSVELATQVGSIRNEAGGDASSRSSNGSQMRIENSSENRFWEALAGSIAGIIGSADESGSESLFVNPEAGLITVRADSRQHAIIDELIAGTVSSARRQVLIEATVVEVTLNNNYESGVDWSLLDNNGGEALEYAQVLAGLPGAASAAATPDALLTYRNSGRYGDVTATLRLLQQFGDVQVLSSPKIIAMNNQPAVLKVVDNRVYFTFQVNQQQRENGEVQTLIDSTVHSVPVGLVMHVTAFVSEDDEVVLNVRPTISRILNFAEDPGPALAGQSQIRNLIPEIQVREMESMLRVSSGQVAIIGGLMQNRADSRTAGLPGISRVPLLGKLFSRDTDTLEKTELLVFLRPTVIHEKELRHHTQQLRRFMPVSEGNLLQSGLNVAPGRPLR